MHNVVGRRLPIELVQVKSLEVASRRHGFPRESVFYASQFPVVEVDLTFATSIGTRAGRLDELRPLRDFGLHEGLS